MRLACFSLILALACGGSSNDNSAGVDASTSAPDAGGPVTDGGVVPVSMQVCSTERVLVSNQSVIHRKEYTYDANGRVAVLVQKEGWDFLDETQDVSGDNLERHFYYSYDRNGRQTTFEIDTGGDGIIDWMRYYHRDPGTDELDYYVDDRNILDVFEWQYRGDYQYVDGRLSEFQEVRLSDDYVANRTNYTYVDGQLRKLERNQNPDGTTCIDWTEVRVYDANKRLLRSELEGYPNGTAPACPNALVDDGGKLELVVHYDYDDDGRLIQRRYDTDGDSSIERRETLTYDCGS